MAKKTNLLVDDPMMWFVMMLIPCGPSAMGLIATAEAQGVKEMEMMAISKFLTVIDSSHLAPFAMLVFAPWLPYPAVYADMVLDLVHGLALNVLHRCLLNGNRRYDWIEQ